MATPPAPSWREWIRKSASCHKGQDSFDDPAGRSNGRWQAFFLSGSPFPGPFRGGVVELGFYGVLQISPAATFDEVHKAYRALAMLYHPDRNSRPGAGSEMAAINAAYSVLSDPVRRRQYDHERLKAGPFDVAGPILRAAYETLL